MRLKDKVAIITGGNDGIGKATALLFSSEGARVVIAARREKEGRETVEEIGRKKGEAIFVKTDTSVEADDIQMVETAIKKFGKLDILVNCAAAQIGGSVLDAKPEDYDRVFSVNVKGYGLCAKAAIPYLLKSGKGAIVNVASLNGIIGTPNRSIYNASKAAVIELSKSMAMDFPTIRVNSVMPGFTKSAAMMNGLSATGIPPEECALLISRGSILKRMAEPIEIAYGILFLSSDEASYITASSLLIDGGIAGGIDAGKALLEDPRFKG
jgi:dihydroanticapsin dehydrogenase